MKNTLIVGFLVLVLISGLATACSGKKGSPAPQATAAPQATGAPPTVSAASKAVPSTQAPVSAVAPQATETLPSASANSPAVADAPMPANPVKYDTPRAVKIGEAVRLAKSGLVFQVSGVRTVPNDATSQFVVADVVIGNTGQEVQTISSLMLFGIVAGGWHWYGISLESIPQMIALKLPLPFDGDIAPGKAARGSLPILVPNDANGLTLTFQSMPAIVAEDPTVFVPLGIRGDGTLPLVAGEPPAVVKGKTYKVGEAFTAPKRGLVVKVNGYWERVEDARDAQLDAGEKFILVDVTAAPLPGSKGISRFGELSLLTADGKEISQTDRDGDVYLAESVQADSGLGRGVAVFRAPKSAAGLKLSFDPVDPASPGFVFGSGDHLADEQALVDLSGGVSTVPAILNPLPAAAATATPEAPAIGDSGSVAAELKVVPVPPGFAVVKDSATRYPEDGTFEEASVTYFGKGDIKTIKDFFKQNLTAAAGFDFADEDISSSGPNEGDLSYSYSKDGASYGLNINLSAKAGGVEIWLDLTAS